MRKKRCIICGDDLLDGEDIVCPSCELPPNLQNGVKNVRTSIRRETSKERRENSKRRTKEEG
jgi:uncharacterized Zn finger protein (UPF0148 family)